MHDTRPAPGEIIGYRKDGRPVRLQAGGSEAAVEAPPAPPAAPPAAAPPAPEAPQPTAPRVPPGQPEGGQFAAQPPAPPAPAPPPAPQAPPGPDWKAKAEAAEQRAAEAEAAAKRWKDQSRVQETRSKANHQRVQGLEGFFQQVAEKLEIPFDDKPDPEEVNRRLEASRAEARQLKVERAIYLNAAKSSADPNAILDSREFIARTTQIDPDAVDFEDQVADLVREAAKQPKYQFQQVPTAQVTQPPAPVQQPAQPQAQAPQQPPAAPPAPSSGADFSGAPGGNRLWTQADYDYWIAPGRDRDGKIMAKAIEDGLLVNLGVGKPSRKSRRW